MNVFLVPAFYKEEYCNKLIPWNLLSLIPEIYAKINSSYWKPCYLWIYLISFLSCSSWVVTKTCRSRFPNWIVPFEKLIFSPNLFSHLPSVNDTIFYYYQFFCLILCICHVGLFVLFSKLRSPKCCHFTPNKLSNPSFGDGGCLFLYIFQLCF